MIERVRLVRQEEQISILYPFISIQSTFLKVSELIYTLQKKLSELINTLWQQKEPLGKLKDEMGTYDPPQNCQKHAITYCNEEIWNEHLQSKHRNVDLKAQKMQKTINKGSIILGVIKI